LWIFAATGSGWQFGEAGYHIDRFLAAWVVLAAIAAVFYWGAGAGHALWLILRWPRWRRMQFGSSLP
jgi:hypothetical protein